MKLLYIVSVNRKRDLGIWKKIETQLEAFGDYGIQAKCERINVHEGQLLGSKLKTVKYEWDKIKIKDDVNVLYIRYPKASFELIIFLKRVKKRNPNCKVLIEIPTYPYAGERTTENSYIDICDKLFRKMLKNYVDRIVTFSNDKVIFGIKTIRINNGINFSENLLKENLNDSSKDIHMIAVATMKSWHGYERLIIGISDYYKENGKRNVFLHMVGTGPELIKYQQLVSKNKLKDKIIFYGKKEGKELDSIFNTCDIGVLSLGNHRKNLFLTSELKSREYAAKGLLMIGSCKCDVFSSRKYPYFYLFPSSECHIDVQKIIDFYDKIFKIGTQREKTKKEIAMKIREYAEKKCDIHITMQPVIKYLKNNVK
ncbi:MAG: glycosyltransferase [Lachnospiraceae bacterium]|nr:glycosyltransferase [Lachnospiraceae bacterium]